MESETFNTSGQPARFWLRALAKLADLLLFVPIVYLSFCLLAVLHTVGVSGAELLSVVVLVMLLWLAYSTYFNSGGRQTLGYGLAGIKVALSDGETVGSWRSLWRALLNTVFLGTLIYLLVGLVAYLPIAVTKSKWALHDLLSGTRVVRTTAPRGLALGLSMLACAVLSLATLFLVVRPFFIQVFYLPTSAMKPTIRVNDRILVNKLYYRFRSPERGDVVVFYAPERASHVRSRGPQTYVKRVIGLPGDVIEVKDGLLHRDGRAVDEERHTLEPHEYEMTPVKVPRDTLFVLGDNRNNSNDSHAWGPLPKENIIGKVVLIYPQFREI